MSQVLLLNADFSPLRTISLQRALSLIFNEKVDQIDIVSDKKLRSPSISIPFPSVLRLKRYVNVPQRHAVWSRRAVFARDHYTCSYCGQKLDRESATLDHIMPKVECSSKGIRASVWSNTTCCCRKCNFRKGSKNMRDAGMKFHDPNYIPRVPRVSYIVMSSDIPDQWRVYIKT